MTPLSLTAVEKLADAFTVRLEGSAATQQRDRDMKTALLNVVQALRATRAELMWFTQRSPVTDCACPKCARIRHARAVLATCED